MLNSKCQSLKTVCKVLLIGSFVILLPTPAALAGVSQTPLSLTTGGLANILVILDNSNSMDENASGAAVGSDSEDSKSEIARSAVKTLIKTYTDELNMGLMAYKQSNVKSYYLHNSPYDISFDPDNFDADFTGNRDSSTKKYQTRNPSDTNNYIYYNVALPMYSSSKSDTVYCYSKNAGFPGSSSSSYYQYTCWKSKTGTSDEIPTSTQEAGNYGYSSYYTSTTLSPTDSDIAQDIYEFGKRLMWTYVGKTWYSNSSPGRGYLHVPIALLDDSQAELLNVKLETSQFSSNKPTDANYPLQNAGLTPVEGTLLTALDYFSEDWRTSSEGYTSACYPLPESCDNNFVVLVTDGLPSVDKNGNTVSDADAALANAADAVSQLADAGITTYVIGFAMPYGTDDDALDILAETGGTGTAILADDEESLTAALEDIFDNIKKASSAVAGLAANSTQLDTSGSGDTTYLYQATFNSTDWSGVLTAYPMAADGTVGEEVWSTNDSGVIPNAASRNIFTWNSSEGVEFTADNLENLSSDQQTALSSSSDLINWVRGDSSLEDGTNFRTRSSAVGDIINSTPAYVYQLDYNLDLLSTSTTGQSTYNDFVSSMTDNLPTLYFGANDGMLHALQLNKDETDAKEIFAYIPEAVFGNLAELSSPDYSSHQFFVDGSPVVYHAYLKSRWRTVLLCTTGRGGKSIFALDITDPDSFSASDVLWEYSTVEDTSGDLGYTIGKPVLVHLADSHWGVVFGNGYDSDNGRAYLYVLNAENGALITKIATNSSTDNGLSTPSVVADANRTASIVYAGDLLGNIWKFDLSDEDPTEWSVDDNAGGNNPLFTARYDSTQTQPITGPLNVSSHDDGGYMIFFGTGQYYAEGDNVVDTDPDVQSLYGIWDDLDSRISNLDRSDLIKQSILYEGEYNDTAYRVTSYVDEANFAWTAEEDRTRGWYMDLISPVNGAEGERVVTKPTLKYDRVIFTTLIPTQETCSTGGSSWLMELTATTGNRPTSALLDLNGDGVIDENDTITIDGVSYYISGLGSDMIDSNPLVLDTTDGEEIHKVISSSDGSVKDVLNLSGDSVELGRHSWRQLK
ncbi:pilus assembly protein [Pelobacter seleniigenes]|uniref:pilus assembly protein n=1 Tax=Pelobacter seleniigenes TaxID=407188 RepID=UPI00068D8A48|nr:PilC/PilY family type IV pilus protein [Pelobacter seleniigenes]